MDSEPVPTDRLRLSVAMAIDNGGRRLRGITMLRDAIPMLPSSSGA